MSEARHSLRLMATSLADSVQGTLGSWLGSENVRLVGASVVEDGSTPYDRIAFPAAAVIVEYGGATGGGTVLVMTPGAAHTVAAHILSAGLGAPGSPGDATQSDAEPAKLARPASSGGRNGTPESAVAADADTPVVRDLLHLEELERSALAEVANQVLAMSAAQLSDAVGDEVEIGPVRWARPGSSEAAGELVSLTPYATVVELRLFGSACLLVSHVPRALVVRMGDVLNAQASELVDEAVRAHADRSAHDPVCAVGLDHVRIELTVELGRARVPLERLAQLGRGEVVALRERHDAPFVVCANGVPIAQARLVQEADGTAWAEITERFPLVEGARALPGDLRAAS